MIVVLYGKTCAPFVEPLARHLAQAATAAGGDAHAVPLESVLANRLRWLEAQRLYVFPFDAPPAGEPARALLAQLFPRAEIANSVAAHELCWDKLATAERLLARGVRMPDSVITSAPEEVHAFVAEHRYAILKDPRSCGGHGHVVLMMDENGTLAGEAHGRRYVVELQASGLRRSICEGVLSWPAPFYVQRLVTGSDRRGALRPAQILRAYVVQGQIVLWTERYRERIRRASDFIINASQGARYRFLTQVSEEASKIALRAADVLGASIAAVDLVRTGSEGPYVLEVDTDGPHMYIDRQFMHIPEYRDAFDFDRFIAEALVAPAAAPGVRTQRVG